jgi:hypothetical protein
VTWHVVASADFVRLHLGFVMCACMAAYNLSSLKLHKLHKMLVIRTVLVGTFNDTVISNQRRMHASSCLHPADK